MPGTGGEEPSELPQLKFPYVDPIEDGATNSTAANATETMAVDNLQKVHRATVDPGANELDFNKELLKSLKIAKHKRKPPPMCDCWMKSVLQLRVKRPHGPTGVYVKRSVKGIS